MSIHKRSSWAAATTIAVHVWSITPLALVADLYGLVVPSAMAVTDIHTNAGAVDSSKLKAQVSCGGICGNLVEDKSDPRWGEGDELNPVKEYRVATAASGTGYTAMVTATGTWEATDHQWCADHGEITDVSFQPGQPGGSGTTSEDKVDPRSGGSASGGTGSTGAGASGSCPVPLKNGETVGDCQTVNIKLLRCKFHNSELMTKCKTYHVADDGVNWQWVLLAYDTAATAVCTTACLLTTGIVSSAGSPVWNTVCEGAAIGSAAKEIAATVFLNQSFLHNVVGLSAAAGTSVFAGFGLAGKNMSGNSAGKKGKGEDSCWSAAFLAIMVAARAINIISIESTRSSACDDIKKMVSDAAVSGGADGSGTGGTMSAVLAGIGSSGAGTGGSATGTNGSSSGGSDSQEGVVPDELPTGMTALDGGVLQRSGLDKIAAPLAKQLDKDEFLKGNRSAGALLAGAMSPAVAAGGGSELAAIADALQKNPEYLPNEVRGALPSSGGGGGSGGGGSSPMAGLGSLFGGGGGDPKGALKTETFGDQGPKAPDIWHAGTHMNIFEIVSGKIEKVNTRVGTRR